MSQVLQVDNVVKAYGDNVALKGVSFNIPAGSFVALLGPNGAGKTTPFQLLTGLFAADSGTINIDGFDIAKNPVAVLARLGVVFQQATLDLDMSVRANLRFHASLHGIGGARRRQRIDEELQRAGLSQDADRLCRELSGGNRRKVELARALLAGPKVLLMDEATVGLDPASRQTLVSEVRSLCREQGTAVLWATHLVDEADGADSVIVLHRGEVLHHAPPQDVIASTSERTLSAAFTAMTT